MAVSGGAFVEELSAAFTRRGIDLPVSDGPPFRPGWVGIRVPGWIVSAAAVRVRTDGTMTWEVPDGAVSNAYYVAFSQEDGSFFGSHLCTDLDLLATEVLAMSTVRSPRPAPLRVEADPWTDLRALRRRRRARPEPVASRFDDSTWPLVHDTDQERVADDLARLDEERIVENFPRTNDGRLDLGVTVLLASYEGAEPTGRTTRCWLVAAGPARRADPSTITIRISPLRGDGAVHRWDRTRWLWDATEDDPWQPLDVARRQVPLGVSLEEIDAVAAAVDGSDEQSVAQRSLAAQDACRFDEAFAAAGLGLGEHVRRVLGREIVPLPDTHQDPERWWGAARQTLWRLDPFRAVDAVSHHHRAADERARSAPGRRVRAPVMKLGVLPGSPHLVRPCLVLVAQRDGGDPVIDVVMTGSNRRVPLSEWQRPVAVDLHRLRDPSPATP